MEPEKLDKDQLQTIKTLPAHEAVQKELTELKKVIEVPLNITELYLCILIDSIDKGRGD